MARPSWVSPVIPVILVALTRAERMSERRAPIGLRSASAHGSEGSRTTTTPEARTRR